MQNKKKVYLIISIVSFSIVLAALAAIGGLLLAYKRQSDNYEQLAAAARTAAPAAPTTPATEAVEETQPGSTVIAESLFLPDFYHGVKIKKLPALLW